MRKFQQTQTNRLQAKAVRIRDGGYMWYAGVWRTDGGLEWSDDENPCSTRGGALAVAQEAKRALLAGEEMRGYSHSDIDGRHYTYIEGRSVDVYDLA
jgi:hypothetical protein